MKIDKTKHPVIVLGLYFPGVDILKAFLKEGIYGIGMDYDDAPGLELRAVETFKCPDPMTKEKEWIDFLLQFKQIGENDLKPVILNTSDIFINALLNHAKMLSQYFLFHNSKNRITQKLMNKADLIRLSSEANLPLAKTVFFNSLQQIEIEVNELNFPLLIRPEFGKKWREEPLKSITKGEKLIKVANKKELIDSLKRIISYDKNLIIQEIINGPDKNLLYVVCYIDRNKHCTGYFCGQKLRLLPVHFGSATYMRTYAADDVLKYAKKLLIENHYHGPAGVEFKKDDLDGQYKIVEINTRYGLWDVIGKKIGVDIFTMGYNDLLGKKQQAIIPEKKTVYWWSLVRDIPVFKQYHKEKLITLGSWLATFLKGPYIADLYWDEPKMMYALYIRKLMRKIRNRKKDV